MDNLTPEQIKQMITLLQQMLPKDTLPETKEPEQIPEPEIIPKNIFSKKTRPKFVNQFEQMQEYRLHKDDVAIDKTLSVYGPTPRRKNLDILNVTCRVCGKKENISSRLLHDAPNRYKCNDCSRSPG